MADDYTSVRVAVRIRPQISREIIEMCHVCTSVSPGEPQVWLGKDKTFTFDHVFDIPSAQEEVYDTCISPLIEGCFEGYNATVFAYGQTGSGKTYTMGTGFDINLLAHESGIIPRAVRHLFNGISERQRMARDKGETPPEFKINAQFMELYNEEIIDLLNPSGDLDEKDLSMMGQCLPSFQGKRGHIKIHEDSRGGIYTVGVTTRAVTSVEETLQCLKVGALSRTTGSTQMNSQSSRSHAIFTLHVKQQRIIKVQSLENLDSQENDEGSEFETLTAKFHFVDLAGSERLKRTGATGERAKEGISINCGLLALGNVISALGDRNRRVSHVPYRDSKLTRLLQDSLGGNSQTLMIACVSPSDRDFMETLNTLKYANRAKNIKNKVTVNQDKSSQTIASLRKEIQMLELELMEYKQGKRVINEDGSEQINDMFHENTMLQNENTNLRTRIKALQETIERLTVRNSELLAEKQTGAWITSGDGSKSDITEMIQGYIKEIEELRAKLVESEEVCTLLRRQTQRAQNRLSRSPTAATISMSGDYGISMEAESHSSYELMVEARKDIRKLKKKARAIKKDDEDEEKQEDTDRKQNLDEDGNEANGIDEEDEESSESESEDKEEQYSEDLAELTCEISIKEKLIQELEHSQRRLLTMRQHYEEKLTQLQHRIKQTEQERDRVLANLGPTENQSDEKVKRVKDQFEKKLSTLQSELRKMQAAKREHAQLMKTQTQHERQLRQLKDEVLQMKQTKVRLLTKIKEEGARHQEEVKRSKKEIDQLRKDGRRKESQIRNLEAEKRLKENILRRKQEEVNALRRNAKPMSDRVAGRFSRRAPAFSQKEIAILPKVAKQKWQNLEKNINKLVLNKQCVYNVERDMDRWLHDREKLVRCLERLLKKRDRAILDGKDESAIRDVEDQVESLKANIEYLHENINECQQNISQLEEAKDDFDALDMNSLMNAMHLNESKYLIEKLLNMAIHQSFVVAQKDLSIKEMEVKLTQVVENNSVQQQLLQHLLHQADEDMYNFAMAAADNEDVESAPSTRSVSPVDVSQAEAQPGNTGTFSRRDKARRKTATTEELLYVRETMDLPSPNVENVTEDSDNNAYLPVKDISLLNPHVNTQDGIHRVTSAPGSLREMGGKARPDQSPSLYRKSYNILPEVSPAMRRKNYSNLNRAPSPPSRQNSVDTTTSDITPPGSPPMGRRNREDNVFSRLTSSIKISNKPDRGIIVPYLNKTQLKNNLLVCSHIAEGHSKAVLSITATDDVLFSSSKDRTVKIWDLHTAREIQSLSGHPNNVVAVRYCEYNRLAFSVSASYVKVWDVRENPAKCLKTLSSSGLAINGAVVQTTPSRTSHMPPGEQQINDIALNQYGTTLYSAAGNTVRIWDLKMFHCIGKLSGGHQAAVMCLAVDDLGMDTNLVVTGSKDHYIKVFEVVEGVTGMHSPKLNLSPPHYDGIQSLAISGDYLFSGSRDMCIKKWDLSNNTLVQSLNQAHKDWVCALSFLPTGSHLLSGCRGGFLKLWSVDGCHLLGEIQAHNAPINSITTNSSVVFTASNDSTVRIWRKRESNDASPDYSDFGDDRF